MFALAIAAQIGCFAMWWHYMSEAERAVEKLVAAEGVAVDDPHKPGWTGFTKRHVTLIVLALGLLGVGAIFVFAFAVAR